MPVLPAEASIYPERLLDELCTLETTTRSWRVLHTKPRQEKAVARELLRIQTPFYLPLMARRSRRSGRIITSYLPLFNGYVFALSSYEEQQAVLATHRVANSLDVFDQDQLRADLQQIYQLISTELPVHPEERFAPGIKVLIRSGPLEGLHGEVLRAASGRRFVVKVNFLQQGASVLLDDVDLAHAEVEQ
jgi:transcriptional antiterminator RfaH